MKRFGSFLSHISIPAKKTPVDIFIFLLLNLSAFYSEATISLNLCKSLKSVDKNQRSKNNFRILALAHFYITFIFGRS